VKGPRALNKQTTQPTGEQFTEQREQREEALSPPAAPEKKPFVEPSVSVPVDVLEATTFFGAPTVETVDV